MYTLLDNVEQYNAYILDQVMDTLTLEETQSVLEAYNVTSVAKLHDKSIIIKHDTKSYCQFLNHNNQQMDEICSFCNTSSDC